MIVTSIFLSYARGDDTDPFDPERSFVARLYQDLTANGFEVWFDRVTMPSRGLTFYQEIQDAIAARDRLVLVVGPKAELSDYVRQEWKFALRADKAVTPIMRHGDDRLVPDELKLLHYDDFRDDTHYAFQLKNLVRQLREPVPALGKLIAVPSLPDHYLARADLLRTLRDAIRADLDQPIVITGAAARVGVHGMGGIGKSVLANALVRDRKVREAFPDGIVWVGVGPKPMLIELQQLLHRAVKGDGAFVTVHEGKWKLKESLASLAVLLILDDVWNRAHADAFEVLGPRCRALITTRNVGLLTAMGGTHHVVALLSNDEAMRLLSQAAGTNQDLPTEDAVAIVAECGRLPLAVALCGALLRRKIGCHAILEQLQQARIDRIVDPHAMEMQHESVWSAIHVSVEDLRTDRGERQQRFLELGVFPPGETIPEAAISTLWAHTGHLDKWETQELLVVLEERSLIQFVTTTSDFGRSPLRRASLHDLIYDYIQRAVSNPASLHTQILAAYQQKCMNGWPSGPNDEYFFSHLRRHMVAVGRERELADLILESRWFEEKHAAGLTLDLASDIATALRELQQSEYRRRLFALIEAQGRSRHVAMARMTIRCLTEIAEHDPAGVGKVLRSLVERRISKGGPAAAQASIQAARVALEAAVATCHRELMAESVQYVLLGGCAAADSNVRSMAVVAIFRVLRINYSLGLSILEELARRSVRFGFPRRLELFGGCALALYFERFQDEKLVRALQTMARKLAARLWWLKPALWIAPKIAEVLLATLPASHLPVNPDELVNYKKYMANRLELNDSVNEMIAFFDPGHGTSEQFIRILNRIEGEPLPPEANMAFCATSPAWASRVLAGDESVLEAVYQLRKQLPPDNFLHQDFMFWIRVVQIGRRHTNQDPLGEIWKTRIEAAIRDFFYKQHGVFRGANRVYVVGGMNAGLVFLTHQPSDSSHPLIEELIEWSSAGKAEMRRWPETPRKEQPDALLMYVLELMGVESGLSNSRSRQASLFGIGCFLKHESKFDEYLRDRVATILVRISVYAPEEVSCFLEKVPDERRNALEVRMNRILPKENVGLLLSNFELLFASILSESAGKVDGLRKEWQDFLRTLLGPKDITATLRYGIEKLLYLIRGETSTPVS